MDLDQLTLSGTSFKASNKSLLETFFSSHKLWLGVFLVWLTLISGLGMHFSFQKKDIYKPGILQAYELYQLKKIKGVAIEELESTLSQLELEREELQKNPLAQEKAIRKVLGYAQKNELVFDFSKR